MKKKVLAVLLSAALLMMASSCSIPVIGDLFESESSLGKTNNTAVTIAAAMKDYLKNKKKTDLALYGLEMILNSDGNGTVKLYYTAALPDKAAYSDIYVSEVDSKTGHVERFGRQIMPKTGSRRFKWCGNAGQSMRPLYRWTAKKPFPAGLRRSARIWNFIMITYRLP